MNEIKAVGARGEKSLHAALKRWYARPGDQIEAMVDGYRIDIVRDDLLIEIQTHNFGALRDKLNHLLAGHTVRLVYPIAVEKWIVRLAADGALLSRRRSPKRGRVEDVFTELIRLPALLSNPHFTLEVLLIRAEEHRRDDGLGSWRRQGWSLYDHILLDVIEPVTWATPQDLLYLLPPQAPDGATTNEQDAPDGATMREPEAPYDAIRSEQDAPGRAAMSGGIPRPFTAAELATALGITRSLAQKMVYCLRHMGLLEGAGRRGRSVLYKEKASQP